MSQSPKGRQDFSDIDHLDRATESFMRGQRKALEGYRPPRRRYFRSVDLHKISRFAAVFAVLAVIVGTVVFAGIRFGKQDAGFVQPEPDPSPSSAVSNDPAPAEPETTAAPPATETEVTQTAAPQTSASTSAPTSSSSSSTTQPQSVTETEETARTSAPTSGSSSSTSRTTTTGTSSQTQHQQVATAPPPATTATTAPTTRTTTATTSTTARSSTRLTSRSTTTSTTTTTTATTAAKAIITVKRVNLNPDDLTVYNGQAMQTIYITVENIGNATLSGAFEVKIKCVNAGTISHVGCQSGNVASGIMTSGEDVYLRYNGALAPGSSDTIQLTVISEDPIWRCSF